VNLAYALLADYAQVEGGKVFIFGGGITVLWRPGFPAPMAVTVVLSVAYNNLEAGSRRKLRLQINDADGQGVAPPLEAEFTLPPRAANVPASVPLESAFAVSIAPNIPIIPAEGNYVVELMIDDNHVRSLPFAALRAPSAQQPE
jgi:hypothetical protein